MSIFSIGKDILRQLLKHHLEKKCFYNIMLTSKKFHILSDQELIEVYKKFVFRHRDTFICTICFRQHDLPLRNTKTYLKKYWKKHQRHVKRYHDPEKLKVALETRKKCEGCSLLLGKTRENFCHDCYCWCFKRFNCKENFWHQKAVFLPYWFLMVRECRANCGKLIKCDNCHKKILKRFLDYHKGTADPELRRLFPSKKGFLFLSTAANGLEGYVCTHQKWKTSTYISDAIKGVDE